MRKRRRAPPAVQPSPLSAAAAAGDLQAGGRRLLSDCTVMGSVGVGGSIALLLLIGFAVGAGITGLFFWWRERRRMRIEVGKPTGPHRRAVLACHCHVDFSQRNVWSLKAGRCTATMWLMRAAAANSVQPLTQSHYLHPRPLAAAGVPRPFRRCSAQRAAGCVCYGQGGRCQAPRGESLQHRILGSRGVLTAGIGRLGPAWRTALPLPCCPVTRPCVCAPSAGGAHPNDLPQRSGRCSHCGGRGSRGAGAWRHRPAAGQGGLCAGGWTAGHGRSLQAGSDPRGAGSQGAAAASQPPHQPAGRRAVRDWTQQQWQPFCWRGGEVRWSDGRLRMEGILLP